MDDYYQWMVENLLYFDKSFGIHTIGATLLQSAQAFQQEEADMAAEQIINDSPKWHDLGANLLGTLTGYKTAFKEWQLSSYMGRVNYALMNKYLLTASVRYDGSSVLAPGNKWDVFPSFALAWKMQEESFMSSVSAISQSKIRIGWGITGNSLIPPYQATGALRSWNYNFGSNAATGYAIKTPPNEDLNWERTAQFNIGYDFGFFKNRLSGSVDVYNANTYDILMLRKIPVSNGARSIL